MSHLPSPITITSTPFGRMGDSVSTLGFGAWAIGSKGYGPVSEEDAWEAFSSYVDNGGTFIDTARGYGNSEELIGKFRRRIGDTDPLFLCSKTPALAENEIRGAVETSLRHLKLDCLDLMYLHAPPENPEKMMEVLEVFATLKKEGKLRGIGASIKGPSVTEKTQSLCRQYISTGLIDALQIIFSVFRQQNRAIFAEAEQAGVALVGRTCLESGFLTGAYAPGYTFPEEDHRSRWSSKQRDDMLTEVAEMQSMPVMEKFSRLSDLAIRFSLDEPGLTTVIVGAKNGEQARINLAAAHLSISPATWRDSLISRFQQESDLGNPLPEN